MVTNCLGLSLVIEKLEAAGANEAANLVRASRVNCEALAIAETERTKGLPPLIIRGVNFASAMFRWASSGMPRRTQAEIDERLAICQICPHLVDNHCQVCGCPCVETNQLINKLALATEACPLGKWK